MADMQADETKNITVVIAGRPYPLKIKVSDESSIRKIVKEVNDRINQFQQSYSQRDKQDCLSMAILTYAVEMHRGVLAPQNDEAIHSCLDLADSLLHSLLSNN